MLASFDAFKEITQEQIQGEGVAGGICEMVYLSLEDCFLITLSLLICILIVLFGFIVDYKLRYN